jgi:elongation factor G
VYFYDEIVGGVVPKEYIPSVEAGFRNMAKKGSKYPFPFVDLEACLFDGKIHDVDSSQDAFRSAAEENFRDAQVQAGINLLEPIMTVVVVTPESYQGAITGDVNRRRGIIARGESVEADRAAGHVADFPLVLKQPVLGSVAHPSCSHVFPPSPRSSRSLNRRTVLPPAGA